VKKISPIVKKEKTITQYYNIITALILFCISSILQYYYCFNIILHIII